MAPSVAEALFGGLRTFFSVWQICLLQITPFYLAFFLGSYFLVRARGRGADLFVMALIGAGLIIGFSCAFGLVNSGAFAAGSAPEVAGAASIPAILAFNDKLNDKLNLIAGSFIMAVGVLMVFLAFARFAFNARALAVLSPLAGASIAAGYSPCSSPALLRIIIHSTLEGGGSFALFSMHAAGISIAMTLSCFLLILLLDRRRSRIPHHAAIPIAAALTFMAMGFLMFTGRMHGYNEILLNLF